MRTPNNVRLTKAELRKMFADQHFLERMKRGDFKRVQLWEGHPSPQRSGEPFCTVSQIFTYLDENLKEVVTVHQYRHQDGTLGGSQLPDPQRIIAPDGTIYYESDEF